SLGGRRGLLGGRGGARRRGEQEGDEEQGSEHRNLLSGKRIMTQGGGRLPPWGCTALAEGQDRPSGACLPTGAPRRPPAPIVGWRSVAPPLRYSVTSFKSTRRSGS